MYVVVGAAGKVGRQTCRSLRDQRLPVRALVRRADTARSLADMGCEVVAVDLLDTPKLASQMIKARSVQLICPLDSAAQDVTGATARLISSLAEAVAAASPAALVVISDYGAHRHDAIGIPKLFHGFEETMTGSGIPSTIVRSAEHMQNWTRLLATAANTGVLPSLHTPSAKAFPMVSAIDVGRISARYMALPAATAGAPHVVHVEGPRRYTPDDVRQAAADALDRGVTLAEVPESARLAMLLKSDVSARYAALIAETFAAHDCGWIDKAPGANPVRGETDLKLAFSALVQALRANTPSVL